ncbi:MAG: NfeD family protein [Bacteroidetes bacterium]|nr:NfeD family protein [Bacteroidota bacterium]MBU1720525.1 NfeD family protein [Bacteroidota bacterium]
MSLTIIITLIAAGLFFLVLEILILPGGVVGLLGVLMMGGAIYASYTEHGEEVGHYTLATTLITTAVGVYFSLKSKTWKNAMLEEKIDSRVNTIEEGKLHIGDEGVTVGRLVPMGKAMFHNEYFEVQSYEGLIDPGTPIEIFHLDGNKIIVKPK